jgi:hypothetical protein
MTPHGAYEVMHLARPYLGPRRRALDFRGHPDQGDDLLVSLLDQPSKPRVITERGKRRCVPERGARPEGWYPDHRLQMDHS